jgi:hypothetical protein
MAYTIPAKIYERLEEKLGRETASVIVEALEASIRSALEDSKERLKVGISEELKKELATRYDLKLIEAELQRIEVELRTAIHLLREEMLKEIGVLREETHKEIGVLREETHKEIGILREETHKEIDLIRKDMKIMEIRILAILIIVMLLLNQGTIAFIARILGLLK